MLNIIVFESVDEQQWSDDNESTQIEESSVDLEGSMIEVNTFMIFIEVYIYSLTVIKSIVIPTYFIRIVNLKTEVINRNKS